MNNKVLLVVRRTIGARPENKLLAGSLAGFFIAGFLIGLIVFGWWLWPVVWVDAGPGELAPADQALYVQASADLYSYQRSQWRVQRELAPWGGDVVACELARQSDDLGQQARLVAAAYAVNGKGCLFDGQKVER